MTPLRRYYRGHNLVAMRDVQAATTSYYHFDHQGTTQCLTNSSGTVTDRFASDAWGVQVKRTGTSINRQWYIGNFGYYRQKDQTLDYVRARYLDVLRGRWLSMDPLGYVGPAGRAAFVFAYGINRPPISDDPSGAICRIGQLFVGTAKPFFTKPPNESGFHYHITYSASVTSGTADDCVFVQMVSGFMKHGSPLKPYKGTYCGVPNTPVDFPKFVPDTPNDAPWYSTNRYPKVKPTVIAAYDTPGVEDLGHEPIQFKLDFHTGVYDLSSIPTGVTCGWWVPPNVPKPLRSFTWGIAMSYALISTGPPTNQQKWAVVSESHYVNPAT